MEKTVKKNNKINISLKEGLKILGLPLIFAYSENQQLTFLLDSGSTNNFIRTDILDIFKDSAALTEGYGTCYGIDRVVHKTKIYNISFEIQGRNFKEEFMTSPENSALDFPIGDNKYVRVHGILGVGFFIKNHFILDFSKQSMYEYEEKRKNWFHIFT